MTNAPPSRRTTTAKLLGLCVHMALSVAALAHLSAGAETRLLKPIHDSQSLIIENNNLSALDFYAGYISKNMPQRRFSEMYLLGVLDATEGKDWCGYRTIKTITLDEAIYTGFKKLDQGALAARASSVIKQILSSRFPCGGRP